MIHQRFYTLIVPVWFPPLLLFLVYSKDETVQTYLYHKGKLESSK